MQRSKRQTSIKIQLSQLRFNDSQEKVTIQKGFSLIPDAALNQIPIGSIIYHSSDGNTRVFDSNGTQLLITDDTISQKITTSAGDFFATNILQVPSGVLINENAERTDIILNNKSILSLVYEKNLSLTSEKNIKLNDLLLDNKINGYIEKAEYSPVFNLSSFTSNWTIPSSPPNPSSGSVQDDLWNGIESLVSGPGRNMSLIQPVTTWFNGNWTSYVVYVDSWNEFFYSAHIDSNIGDKIEGQMTWDPSQSTWTVTVWDFNVNQFHPAFQVHSEDFTEDNLWLMCSLEGHNIYGISDLSGSTTFYDIQTNNINGGSVIFNWSPWVSPNATFLTGLNVTSPSHSTAILYTDKNFAITPSAGPHGTISPSSVQFVRSGDNSQQFTITASSGYQIDTVYINEISKGELHTYTFPDVQSNNTIHATFRSIPSYTITPRASPGGSISPSTPQTVPSGNNMTFLIAPNSEYIIDYVSIDTSRIGPVASYTFFNVTSSHSISANFTQALMSKTGVYRPGSGFYLKMDQGNTWNSSTDLFLAWDNAANDSPIAGDWNIDGRDKTGVYRPGTGFFLKMDQGNTWNSSTDLYLPWDMWSTDLPIAGDWNIDGQDETGVYRPGTGFYLKMDNGNTWNSSTDLYLAWDNAAADLPIAGDWNLDGRDETGVYRPGTGFFLKMDQGNTWNPSTDLYLAWDNAAGDLPIAGDWNLDGLDETGVYRTGAGFFLKMDQGNTWNPSTDLYLAWDNAAGDRPIAGHFGQQ